MLLVCACLDAVVHWAEEATMGRRASRRSLTRRSLPPRPGDEQGIAASAARPALTGSLAASRPNRLVEREAPYLMDELRRVALVTATCVGLLIFLTIVDRMR